jgi:hypothetical protein
MAVKKKTSNTTDNTTTVSEVVTKTTSEVSVQEESAKVRTRTKIPTDELVKVTNATQGLLVLVDNDGYANELENFGDTIEMEMGDLIKIKKRYPKVFSENWIEVNPIVQRALGVEKFYKDFIPVDEFDSIFELDEQELKDKVSKLSRSMKQSVGIRAIKLIEDGTLDSVKKIKALEEVLGYELIEN